MSFWEQRYIFGIKNNSVYGKTTNVTFNNSKKYQTYKKNFCDENEVKNFFKQPPFYKTFI